LRVALPYGEGKMEVELEDEINILQSKKVEKVEDIKREVYNALNQLIGIKSIEFFREAENVCIVVSDQTRPLPSGLIVEAILDKLEEFEVDGSQVTLMVGGGLHAPNEKAVKAIIGKNVLKRVGGLLFHDAGDDQNLVYLGKTGRGTPIWLNKEFVKADKRIVTGAITPHQIMGYTGGAKGAAVGVAGQKTIEATHSLLTSPKARLGILDGNPAREEIEEIGKRAKIDLLVNAVLNSEDEVAKIFAGHWYEAHRAGVKYAKELFEVRISRRADLVLASPGGYPRDIDVYQSQKALATSEIAVKEGGVIILTAECREGIGNPVFEHVMKSFDTPEEVMDYFLRTPFRMGVHKAYLWARTLLRNKVILVSKEVEEETGRILKVELTENLEDALDIAHGYTEPETVAVIPHASTILPKLE
jgi:nickel-dependent lactate racemase